jgi:DNA-binding MarR family transcriptional regulator
MGSQSRQIMDHFRRIVQALRSSHRAAGHLSLTGAQLFVLKVIADAGRALSVKEVAERTQTDQSTVSVVVSRLVERGLVTRKQSAEDTRRAELSLTAQGRAVQKKAPATVGQQRLAASLDNLKPRDAQTLLKYLNAIVDDMQIADDPASMLFSDEAEGAARRRAAKKRARR